MRKLVAIFAMVLVCAAVRPSYALLGLGDMTFDGSLEVNGNSANNESDLGNTLTNTGSNDHRGMTDTRVRVGANMKVTEGVMGRLELVRSPGSAGSAALYGGAAQP